MVFWSINFFARGTRLGSLLLDQTGWCPVKQSTTELWTSKVGIPWWGVAECSSIRGATHRRTGSAGAFQTLSGVSPLFAGWALGGGADKSNLRIQSLPVGNGNPTAPVLHNVKMRVRRCLSIAESTVMSGTYGQARVFSFGVHYG